MITPQSYLPGGAGMGGPYPGSFPPPGPNNYPVLTPNSYLPPPGTIEPPIMNYSGGTGMIPPPISYPPPMMPPPPPFPPPMPYPHQAVMPMGPPPPPQPCYEIGPCPPRRVRVCRRRRPRRRCRPVIRIIDSDSCSSLSSYTTVSSCSRRRHRSRTHSRRCTPPPQQQQQPIILLPIQCQQPPSAVAAPIQNQIQQQQQQQQPQRIILPPIQLQQSGGQFQQQQQQQPFGLSPMQFQQLDGQHQPYSLPPIQLQQSGGQFQQQPFTLPPIQLDSSNLMSSASTNPMIISSGQPMLQPSMSMPQIANIGQQLQGGGIQYVQSSSPLQYVSSEPRSTVIPQRVLVNSTNKKQTAKVKPVRRTPLPARELPQSDLKYGRRPFDWYENDKKNNIINENVQLGKRGSTTVD